MGDKRNDGRQAVKAIDLFAGLGGFTQGALQAGIQVVWAANHWPAAVALHRQNHPEVQHACQDLQQFPFHLLPDHDILLGSPCCQGHFGNNSQSRDYDGSRATAWAIVSALESKRPPLAIIENIPEMQRWELFPAWLNAIKLLGYTVSTNLVDAADCGVAQNRIRAFFVCSRTHPVTLTLAPVPHKAARTIIDWEGYSWRPWRDLCPKSVARIKRGQRECGPDFLAPYYSQGSGLTGRSLDRPLGTVRTCNAWSIVRGDKMRMLKPAEISRAMSFPDHYKLPHTQKLAYHMLGNAVPPLMAEKVIRAVVAAAG